MTGRGNPPLDPEPSNRHIDIDPVPRPLQDARTSTTGTRACVVSRSPSGEVVFRYNDRRWRISEFERLHDDSPLIELGSYAVNLQSVGQPYSFASLPGQDHVTVGWITW
ncbi:hypothetical protein [Nocardia abscessus]|uniref:hypothetical protein n=1 Tax=Nocardia abscessus TaxID=120957 RepID=UPI002457833C|nr:hypothetical protein [Nocardia abscessus]